MTSSDEVAVRSVSLVTARAAAVLRQQPSGLVTDIDGTISRIAPRPEDAYVSARVRAALSALQRRLHLVAVLTARDEDTARRMVGIKDLTYVGNYALDEAAAASVDAKATTRVRQEIAQALNALPGVELEEKGVSFALHYRNAQDPDRVRGQLLALLEPVALAAGTRVVEGKKVIEIVPESLPTKAAALARLVERNGLHGVVYLGDDISDVPAFRELRRRQQAGQLQVLTIAVRDAETDAAVLESADLSLDGVDAVEAFLEGLSEALDGRA